MNTPNKSATPLQKRNLENGQEYVLVSSLAMRKCKTRFSSNRTERFAFPNHVYCGVHEQTGRCMICGRRTEGKPMVTFIDMNSGEEVFISKHCWEYVSVYGEDPGIQTYKEFLEALRKEAEEIFDGEWY